MSQPPGLAHKNYISQLICMLQPILQAPIQTEMNEVAEWKTFLEPGTLLRDRWQKRGALKALL